MFVTITNASKGKPYSLEQTIDNKTLKIGIRSIAGRVGWYNIKEEAEWWYTFQGGQPSEPKTIQPGLYNLESLTKKFKDEIDGLEITLNEETGKIDMTIPADYEIWFPDHALKLLGLDDDGWLRAGDYEGDHAIEFLPKRILIYLKQLSTTNNLSNNQDSLIGSQILGWIPLSSVPFGEYFSITYDKPDLIELTAGGIHELDFDFKVDWRWGTEKLDNHSQPLDLRLIIK